MKICIAGGIDFDSYEFFCRVVSNMRKELLAALGDKGQ